MVTETSDTPQHRLGDEKIHAVWDNSLTPLLTVRSGEVVEMITREASDGQIGRGSGVEALGSLDFGRIHPLTGPILVEGAEAGDALEVEVLDLQPLGWGWTGILPGFGLLADDFTSPHLVVWDLSNPDYAVFKDTDIKVPLDPFMGVMGVGLDETGAFSTIPPRRNGGNIDIKQLNRGSKLYLPVLVPGALLSIGDGHAAQGDGEVCGTAIECPMHLRFRVTLHRQTHLDELQFFTYGSRSERTNQKGYYVTTAHGPDLMAATKKSIHYMIAYLGRTYGLLPEDAYALCSVAADLKISEVVDAPNWIVSAFISQDIFPA